MSEETKKTKEQVDAPKVEKTEATAPVEAKKEATPVVEEIGAEKESEFTGHIPSVTIELK